MAVFHPFFVIVLLLFSLSSSASYDFTPETQRAYSEFLKLKISSGEKHVSRALNEDPNNGIAILFSNFGDVLSVFISEDNNLYNKLKKEEDERIRKIIKLSKDSPYYLFCQAEIKLQWAFVKLKFGDEVNAVWSARQAYKLLEENNRKYPDFIPNLKSLGLLQIILGSIPDKYSSVANLVGMKGDVNLGMLQLEKASTTSNPFMEEAKIYRLLADNYILKHSNSIQKAEELYSANKDNLLITFLYSSIMMKNGESDKALEALKARPVSQDYYPFPFLNYLTAEIYLFKAQYSQSKSFYNKFLETYKGKNFIKDAYYKLFLSFWLNNEEEESKKYIDKILRKGQALYDADKHAQKFAEKGDFPDKILMKCRLYFDGGYYQEALNILNGFSAKDNYSLVEFNYRKGRIYHQLGDYSKAIIFYLKTIELSGNKNYYFAPNSALQMGYIYKEQNNKELARLYFQKALSYQDYEYKNSIDNKAKAAMAELKKKK